jgi:hypothetical protein
MEVFKKELESNSARSRSLVKAIQSFFGRLVGMCCRSSWNGNSICNSL